MSPILFNVYMDELSNQLNRLKTVCLVGNTIVNHLICRRSGPALSI